MLCVNGGIVLKKSSENSFKKTEYDNYNDMNEGEILDLIKGEIKSFILDFEYVPTAQIYSTFTLPPLKFLKKEFGLTYPELLKRIDCDHINGIKIHKHLPKDVLMRMFKINIDDYLKNNGRLPNKKTFNGFKIGSVNFYEGRFNMEYHELLESMGYSLKLKHKPRIYSKYTHDEIFELTREEIQNYYDRTGVLPTQFQYGKLNAPSEVYFKKRHNLTYNGLLLKLGFIPPNTGERYNYLSDEECFESIKREIDSFAKTHLRIPTAKEVQSLNIPSFGYIKKRFGLTYKELLHSLSYKDYEFTKGYFGLPDSSVFDKISKNIKEYISVNGKLPTQKQYDLLNVPSAYNIKKIYNLSYNKLVETLGFTANRK